MKHNVPVQSLIDHIKTAVDVDPWAKEMVEELLKEQEAVVRCKDCIHRPKLLVTDIEDMESGFDLKFPDYTCRCRNDGDDWYSWYPPDDWFCADGERREYVKPQAESATDWDGVECE